MEVSPEFAKEHEKYVGPEYEVTWTRLVGQDAYELRVLRRDWWPDTRPGFEGQFLCMTDALTSLGSPSEWSSAGWQHVPNTPPRIIPPCLKVSGPIYKLLRQHGVFGDAPIN